MLVFEKRNVAEPAILLEIEDAVAEKFQYVPNVLLGKLRQRLAVHGSLDHNFMRAYGVHAVKHALGPAVFAAFNKE